MESSLRRESLSHDMQKQSQSLLGAVTERALDKYVYDGKYHRYRLLDELETEQFILVGKGLLARVAENLETYLEELLVQIQNGDLKFQGRVGDLSWLIGYGDGLSIEAQIASPPNRYALAQPALTMIRNVDRERLVLSLCPFVHSFERGQDLDLSTCRRITVEPEQDIFINGFETLVWPASSGVLFLRVATLSLGAYDALFDVATGEVAGVFSTDVRASYIQTALRLFGAARSERGRALAEIAAASPLRELRWSAVNYFWRLRGEGVLGEIKGFLSDPDPQIRHIAASAVDRLVEGSRHAE